MSKPKTLYPEVAQLVGHVAERVTTVMRDFENAKTVDVYACSITTERMAKQMVRGDSVSENFINRGLSLVLVINSKLADHRHRFQ